MKLRDAKRWSKRCFNRGVIPVDYWSELRDYQPKLYRKNNFYHCIITTGAAKLERRHTCAYRLIVLVAQLVVDNQVRFQRQPQIFSTMSTPLSLAAEQLVVERELPTVGLYGFKHFRPQPLPALPAPHPLVSSVLQANLDTDFYYPDELKDAINGYEHSSVVKDMNRLAPSVVVLGEKPPKPFDFEVFWDLFLRDSLALPHDEDGEILPVDVPEFNVAEMVAQSQTTSAAGLMCLSAAAGSSVGDKKVMHQAAININLRDKTGQHVPGLLPYKPSLKGEVIKTNKKVRTILLESQPNYMVLKHYYSSLASAWSDPAGTFAIGMSNLDGDFKTVIYRWWMESTLPHDDFLDWLDTQQAHESDKSSWESSTNATDGVAFLFHLLMRVNIHAEDRRLVIRALADYFNPCVQYTGQRAYTAPWRVPSGSYLTSYGNSVRHAMMARWVVDWFGRHGAAGIDGCECDICSDPPDCEGWGTALSDEQLRMLSRFCVMGDDFIALNPAPFVFDALIDRVFGTTTKTVVRPVFSESGLCEPTGVEFLRRHFRLDRTQSPYRIGTFRAAARCLAKLHHGGHRHTRERFLAAVDSALNNCGDNQALYRVLLNLHYQILGDEPLEMNKYREALLAYVRKNPTIEFMALGYVPTHADLVNLDASILRPLLEVKRSLACAEWGVTPRMYVHQN